jgi:hypothetical protein
VYVGSARAMRGSGSRAKNAWKVFDYTTIEESLRKALGEARTALRLDPHNANARLDIATLQGKLIDLPSGRKKPRQGDKDVATILSHSPTPPEQPNVRR